MTDAANIVDRIIEKFGGQTKLADAIGVDQSAISRWKQRGVVPARQQQRVLEAGHRLGLGIEPRDFFDLPSSRSRKARAA